MRQATRLFAANRKLTRQDLVTIEPEDILRSSVFSDTDHDPETVVSASTEVRADA